MDRADYKKRKSATPLTLKKTEPYTSETRVSQTFNKIIQQTNPNVIIEKETTNTNEANLITTGASTIGSHLFTTSIQHNYQMSRATDNFLSPMPYNETEHFGFTYYDYPAL